MTDGNAEHMLPSPVAPELVWQVDELNTRYARALNDGYLDLWPKFFSDTCLYRIYPRENEHRGLPGCLLYFDSQAMLRDRVLCIRDVCEFATHTTRHFLGRPSVEAADNGMLRARTNVMVIQCDQEGHNRLFAVGEYRDLIVEESGASRFREKTLLLDDYMVQGELAEPL